MIAHTNTYAGVIARVRAELAQAKLAADKRADWKTELARRATGAGGLAGLGMGAGIVGGATLGALTNKDENGNPAPIRGALAGAFSGANLGLLGGAAIGAARPQWGEKALKQLAGREDFVGKMTRYGGRQVRSLTGVGDTRVLRGGLYDAQKALGELKAIPKTSPAALQRAQQRVDILTDTHQRGLDHLPGLVSAVRREGFIPALKGSVASQWHGGDTLDKTLLAAGVALPLAATAMSSPENRTASSWGGALGSSLGTLITPAHMPTTGAAVTGQLTEEAGRLVGSGLSAINRVVRPTAAPPPVPYAPYTPTNPLW